MLFKELGKRWLDVLAEDFEDTMPTFVDSDDEDEQYAVFLLYFMVFKVSSNYLYVSLYESVILENHGMSGKKTILILTKPVSFVCFVTKVAILSSQCLYT